jgi:inhibitor of cysteine peptidase
VLTKSDGTLIVLGCVIGILLTVILLPFLSVPAVQPPSPAPPVMADKVPVASGTVTSIEQFATKEDVAAFIRSHTEDQSTYSSPGAPAAAPIELLGGNRVWTFQVDTTTFRPDEYIVTATAVIEGTTGTALFNVLEGPAPQNPAPVRQTSAAGNTGPGTFFILIDPIPDHYVGDKFTIAGWTNLPLNAEILVEVYSSSFKPTQKSQSGAFSGATGTVQTREGAAPVAIPAAASAAGQPGAREYSTTNVQVTGVDEADIIKTDGNNIYVVSGSCMHIVRAYPARDAKVLSTLRFSGQPQALYINNNRVVLIATDLSTKPFVPCSPGSCSQYPADTPRTLIYVFSVQDPSAPVLVRELDISGEYTSSRMIGTQLYFVTGIPVPFQLEDLELPVIHDDRGGVTTPTVYGFNTTDQAYAFSTIGSLDASGTSPVTAKTFLVGTAGTVYVSPSFLYIAVPGQSMYRGSSSTTIHSFALDNGKFRYSAGGKVDGTLLNQYSMDEYGGNLRVATTIDTVGGRWTTSSSSKVTVLDPALNSIGTLAGIAPGERIYAARFMGERLYLVTFRQTDPFFVIGLSDPRHPVVLGDLKIPGFSNYLHPYDTGHIIGIGKESQGGALKIALFDVADVSHPVVIDSKTIGGQGSDSPVLTDPKAFLFDREKDLLVLPVHLQGQYNCNARGCTGPTVWGGAYAYGVNPKTGFVLKGLVKHYEGYYGSQNRVKRALYINTTLYTMSDSGIVMSDLSRGIVRINEVRFT